MVVHGDMEIGVPEALWALVVAPGGRRAAAVDAPPPARGHLGDLFDVDVHQLARSL